jgi:hypothetical protein
MVAPQMPPVAPAMPQLMTAPQAYAPLAAPAGLVQAVPVGRARPGITLDFIRIPIPILRLIAVPTTPEITVPLAAPQLVAYQPQAVMPPVAAPQVVAPAAVVPQAPAPAVVPFQGAVVPVQGQALLPIQGQAAVPMVAQPVMSAPVAPQPTQPLSPQDVAEYCRQIDALKAALDASKAAVGCGNK